MAEIDSLLAHHDVHLHCHMLKATDKALAQVLQVVIAHYQIDSTIQTVEHFGPLSSSTQTEVAQVKYCVIGSDYPIPIFYHRFIHLLHILKRSVAELDDVRMVEMGVGREKRVIWIEIEVHCSFDNSRYVFIFPMYKFRHSLHKSHRVHRQKG